MNYNINDYQIKISKLSQKDGGGYIATVPELPGCMSDGETYEEALLNVKEAIKEWIDTAKARGQNIPEPIVYHDDEDYSGRLVIRIPKKLHKELSENAAEQSISLNQLILYYLSKQIGIEEAKKINNIIEDEILQEENKIPTFASINFSKDWESAYLLLRQFMPLNRKGE